VPPLSHDGLPFFVLLEHREPLVHGADVATERHVVGDITETHTHKEVKKMKEEEEGRKVVVVVVGGLRWLWWW
jgi:hypothetical protein